MQVGVVPEKEKGVPGFIIIISVLSRVSLIAFMKRIQYCMEDFEFCNEGISDVVLQFWIVFVRLAGNFWRFRHPSPPLSEKAKVKRTALVYPAQADLYDVLIVRCSCLVTPQRRSISTSLSLRLSHHSRSSGNTCFTMVAHASRLRINFMII